MSGHRPWTELRAEVEAKPGAREEIDAIKRAMDDVLRLTELHLSQEDLAPAWCQPVDEVDDPAAGLEIPRSTSEAG